MATGDVRHIMDMILNSDNQLPLPFAQTPILVNGQDMMNRTFYVDAENGDDNNDGSSSAPFKTIKKACDSVPVGGYGDINLVGNWTVPTPNWEEGLHNIIIYIRNKYIILDVKGQITLSWSENPLDGNNADLSWYFWVENGFVRVCIGSSNNGKLIIPENTTGASLGWMHALFGCRGISAIKVDMIVREDNYCPLEIHDGMLISANISTYENRNILHCGFGHHYSGTNRYPMIKSNNYLIDFNQVPGSLFFLGDNGTNMFVDENGDWVNPSDMIAGIVKDANGVPRNIISNVVF